MGLSQITALLYREKKMSDKSDRFFESDENYVRRKKVQNEQVKITRLKFAFSIWTKVTKIIVGDIVLCDKYPSIVINTYGDMIVKARGNLCTLANR